MLLSEHFDSSEFACHCCGELPYISPRLIELLEQLRYNIGGYPLLINSGYRCPYHNKMVGGVADSQHIYGTAADLAIPNNMSFEDFQWHIEQLPFDWVGLYPRSYFIHVDVRCGGVSYPPTVDFMESY